MGLVPASAPPTVTGTLLSVPTGNDGPSTPAALRPQHITEAPTPPPRVAHEALVPAETHVASVIPLTSTWVLLKAPGPELPLPSSPDELEPQQPTRPLTCRAQVCVPPRARESAVTSGPPQRYEPPA